MLVNKNKYKRPSPHCQKVDWYLMEFMAVNMSPLNLMEYECFQLFIDQLDPCYTLPSREYMKTTVLQDMYQNTMDEISVLLETTESVSLTTDCWSSKATHSYMTVTCHLLTEDFELKSFVLETAEMRESHTAENVEAKFDEILKKFNL